MTGIGMILSKEWRSTLGSEKGVFFVYAIMVFTWSFLFISTGSGGTPEVYTVWLLTFAIVLTSVFAQNVYVAERVSGSLEILLTSGPSRGAILVGKTVFVVAMTSIMGFLCIGLSLVWAAILPWHIVPGTELAGARPFSFVIFADGAFMSAACAAWLSVALPSPRVLAFLNLLFGVFVVGLYYLVRAFLPIPSWCLALIVLAAGGVFMRLAWREFEGEKIIRPVSL
jgi:hypothetical protein